MLHFYQYVYYNEGGDLEIYVVAWHVDTIGLVDLCDWQGWIGERGYYTMGKS